MTETETKTDIKSILANIDPSDFLFDILSLKICLPKEVSIDLANALHGKFEEVISLLDPSFQVIILKTLKDGIIEKTIGKFEDLIIKFTKDVEDMLSMKKNDQKKIDNLMIKIKKLEYDSKEFSDNTKEFVELCARITDDNYYTTIKYNLRKKFILVDISEMIKLIESLSSKVSITEIKNSLVPQTLKDFNDCVSNIVQLITLDRHIFPKECNYTQAEKDLAKKNTEWVNQFL